MTGDPHLTRSDRGRPRRYDDKTERRLLIDGALRAMKRSDDGSISVNDVLAEASLTTRAFYRHFASKDALSETLFLREFETIADSLAKATKAGADPPAAVRAWIERFVDVLFDPKRMRRASRIINIADDRDRGPSARMLREMRVLACAPLIDALEAGQLDGTLHSPSPLLDAFSIYEAIAQVREAGLLLGELPTKATALAHAARFAGPVLGIELWT